VRLSLPSRVVAVLVTTLVGLAAPATALAHGLAHAALPHGHVEHGASEQAAAPPHEQHRDPGVSRALLDRQDQEHGHAAIDVVTAARDLVRHAARVGPATTATQIAALTAAVTVRSRALVDRALLARPDPAVGPPPRLRAPPAR